MRNESLEMVVISFLLAFALICLLRNGYGKSHGNEMMNCGRTLTTFNYYSLGTHVEKYLGGGVFISVY